MTSEQADEYYIHSRFEPYKINEIQNERIANAIFDQSVLTPGIINRNIKRSINDLGYDFKKTSSKLTDEQVDILNTIDSDKFIENFVKHQLSYYESLKGTEVYRVNIKGWRNRLKAL